MCCTIWPTDHRLFVVLHEVSFIPVKRPCRVVAIRKHIKTSMYIAFRGHFVESMGMFGDKQGDSCSDKHSSGLICEVLVASRHIISF